MAAVESPLAADDTPVAEALAAAAVTVARAFAAGATMWCASAEWPAHARHVAVEFVHPVIVGKRALPALLVEGPDLAGALRLLSRPGDVLLFVGSAGGSLGPDLLARAGAWGLTRVWLGAGPRPAPGLAERVVWVPGPDPERSSRSGDMVLLYHLLWELTHVVFEHLGLLAPEPEISSEVCITCADEGRVGEVQTVRVADGGQADVLVAGRVETVDVSLVDPVGPGDLVLVHAGVVLSRLGPEP